MTQKLQQTRNEFWHLGYYWYKDYCIVTVPDCLTTIYPVLYFKYTTVTRKTRQDWQLSIHWSVAVILTQIRLCLLSQLKACTMLCGLHTLWKWLGTLLEERLIFGHWSDGLLMPSYCAVTLIWLSINDWWCSIHSWSWPWTALEVLGLLATVLLSVCCKSPTFTAIKSCSKKVSLCPLVLKQKKVTVIIQP